MDKMNPSDIVEERICKVMHENWMQAYNKQQELLKKDYSDATLDEIWEAFGEVIACENYMKDLGLSTLFYNSTLGN